MTAQTALIVPSRNDAQAVILSLGLDAESVYVATPMQPLAAREFDRIVICDTKVRAWMLGRHGATDATAYRAYSDWLRSSILTRALHGCQIITF